MAAINASGANAPSIERSTLTAYDYALYATTVIAWSFSWIAIKAQVGTVPVQVSVFWRFALAALIMIIWAVLAKKPMRFPIKTHIKFFLMGTFMFCMNFALFYYAAPYLASGLLSVVFSLVSVFNIFIMAIFLRKRPASNMLLGAALGIAGIAMMFWPTIAGQTFNTYALFGLGICVVATFSFCTGNLISATLQKQGISTVSASAWGMTYGAFVSGLLVLISGESFEIDWSMTYISSLLFLAIVSSVIAFAAYLTLLGRIGSDRAGYATLMFPVIALVISIFVEDYHMTLIAGAGLVFVLTGNVFVLGRARKS
ncbi:MAG: EamA family transporter [Hyphomicrobiales bacterium]|nr:MAG: EamA family transporter [Hyphomicrobiales bacterium]